MENHCPFSVKTGKTTARDKRLECPPNVMLLFDVKLPQILFVTTAPS
jgi:hypothetical protein